MSMKSFIKTSCAAVALAAAIISAPYAADFGTSGEPMYSPGRVAQGWGGFYAGAHIGMNTGNYKSVLYSPYSKFDMGAASLSGGVFGGYNWQLNNKWLVGLEGDFGIQNVKKDTIISSTTYTADNNWVFSGRGRVGYVMDAMMVYGTTGLALSNVKFTGGGLGDDKAVLGWVLGAGAEVKLTDKIFGRGEYLYTGFGKEAFAIGANRATAELSTHTIRAGIGYKF